MADLVGTRRCTTSACTLARSVTLLLIAVGGAHCGDRTVGGSGSTRTSTGGSSLTSVAGTTSPSTSVVGTMSHSTSNASTSAAWASYICYGNPCWGRYTTAPDGAAGPYPPAPAWPDGGVRDDSGQLCPPIGAACAATYSLCGPSMYGNCGPAEICAPTGWTLGYGGQGGCPTSTRTRKQDIHYLDAAEQEALAHRALAMPLATYHYKPDTADPGPIHLGFIIEDVPGSPAVAPDGQHVDLYGYVSLAMATIKEQAREIAKLRAEVDALKANASTRASRHRLGAVTDPRP